MSNQDRLLSDNPQRKEQSAIHPINSFRTLPQPRPGETIFWPITCTTIPKRTVFRLEFPGRSMLHLAGRYSNLTDISS